MTGLEAGPHIFTPATEGMPVLPAAAQFTFRDLGNDRVEVYHPFHSTTVLGDRSIFETPYLDDAAVILFQELPYLADTRKLSRPDQLATRPLAGRLSELGSSFSLAVLAKEMGGGPIDVIDAMWNDAPKVYCAHQGDDNYWGHGSEDGHDLERPDFFKRAGIIERFVEEGVLRLRNGVLYVGDTRLTIDSLLTEDEATVRASFVSNKHPARRMDADRFQYNEEERLLMNIALHSGKADAMRLPRAMSALALQNIARRIVVDDGEGDQLIFLELEAARQSSFDYIRHNTEHWCEPVQDMVSDMLNLIERYFFLCSDAEAQDYQYFFPRDYLHTSSTLMHEKFARVAQNDVAMKWMLMTALELAASQREQALDYDIGENRYRGPRPPEWATFTKLDAKPEVDRLFWVDGNKFTIILPPGKMRTVDPRVQYGSGTKPLTELDSDFAHFKDEQHKWIGWYWAEIEIADPATALSVKQALDTVHDKWANVLKTRPSMPDSEFRRNIKEANEFVKRRCAEQARVVAL